eukprot:gb/GECG01015582.1/.p1 GENE.gb/GECG01015582.1/~~gb/GECG01015582.1/.p1  ORF type:complete len:851 (+),score=120.97 gb/GECG01015582.1/:1-2553(+)
MSTGTADSVQRAAKQVQDEAPCLPLRVLKQLSSCADAPDAFFSDHAAAHSVLLSLTNTLNHEPPGDEDEEVDVEHFGNKAKIAALTCLANLAKAPEYSPVLMDVVQRLDEAFERTLKSKEQGRAEYGTLLGSFHQLVLVLLIRLCEYNLKASELLEWFDGDIDLAVTVAASTSKVITYEPAIPVNVASIMKELATPDTYFSNEQMDEEGVGISIEKFLKKVDVLQFQLLGGRPPALESISATLNRHLKNWENSQTSSPDAHNIKGLRTLSKGVISLNKFIHSLYNFVGDSRMGSSGRGISMEWYRQALLATGNLVDYLCLPYLRIGQNIIRHEGSSTDELPFVAAGLGNTLVTLVMVTYCQPLRRLKISRHYPVSLLSYLDENTSLPLICLLFALCCNLDACAPLPPSEEANPTLLEHYEKENSENGKSVATGTQASGTPIALRSSSKEVSKFIGELGEELYPETVTESWKIALKRMSLSTLKLISAIACGSPTSSLDPRKHNSNSSAGLSWLRWVPIEQSNVTFRRLTDIVDELLDMEESIEYVEPAQEAEVSKEEESSSSLQSLEKQDKSHPPHTSKAKTKEVSSLRTRGTKPSQENRQERRTKELPEVQAPSYSVVDLPPPDPKGAYTRSDDPSNVQQNRGQKKYNAREVARKEREMKAKGINKTRSGREEREEEGSVPPEFLCSISGSLMNEPVTRPMNDDVSSKRAAALKVFYGFDVSDIIEINPEHERMFRKGENYTDIEEFRNDPGTAELQKSPVVMSNGNYRYLWPLYDLSSLKSWIKHQHRGSRMVGGGSRGECPLTGVLISPDDIVLAKDIRRDITAFHVRTSMQMNETKESKEEDLYSF